MYSLVPASPPPPSQFPHHLPIHPQLAMQEGAIGLHLTHTSPHPQWNTITRIQIGDLDSTHCLTVAPSLELLASLSENSLHTCVEIVVEVATPPLVQAQLVVGNRVSRLQVSEPAHLEHISGHLQLQ